MPHAHHHQASDQQGVRRWLWHGRRELEVTKVNERKPGTSHDERVDHDRAKTEGNGPVLASDIATRRILGCSAQRSCEVKRLVPGRDTWNGEQAAGVEGVHVGTQASKAKWRASMHNFKLARSVVATDRSVEGGAGRVFGAVKPLQREPVAKVMDRAYIRPRATCRAQRCNRHQSFHFALRKVVAPAYRRAARKTPLEQPVCIAANPPPICGVGGPARLRSTAS